MQDPTSQPSTANKGFRGRDAALQIICLGHSGGPCEENVTGFLVRSVASGWARGSLLAVDAGSHLAPLVRILEQDFPLISAAYPPPPTTVDLETSQSGVNSSRASSVESDLPAKPLTTLVSSGPFAGFSFPNRSARANALHLLRSYISTYLITHPHLDHLSGFVINTAAFHATSRPKTVAALPGTVNAIKKHIFNDVIWPNLTDEDGGVGFVTFQRLKEGGDVMLGEGEGRGYINVCDGLGVKAFKVSHGVCTKGPPSHFHRGSVVGSEGFLNVTQDFGTQGRAFSISQPQISMPGTPNGGNSRPGYFLSQTSPRTSIPSQESCVVDSTAFFIRDCDTAREVLMFGDVEPDSISLTPRNRLIWQEAARKIAHNLLGGICIESSYDNSQADTILFGHLNPRHLIAELQILAGLVHEAKLARVAEKAARKRKRAGQHTSEGLGINTMDDDKHKRSRSVAVGGDLHMDSRRASLHDYQMPIMVDASPFSRSLNSLPEQVSPTSQPSRHPHQPPPLSLSSSLLIPPIQLPASDDLPLAGIKVIVIHIKDAMMDGPPVSEVVLAELEEHERQLRAEGRGLGCEFIIAKSGESYWF